MTTPREIYDLHFDGWETTVGTKATLAYGEACWNAALLAAFQIKIAGADVPDTIDVASAEFWAGADGVRAAIQKLMLKQEDINQFFGKAFAEALAAQDPILKHRMKQDTPEEGPTSPDLTQAGLDGAFKQGFKAGIEAALEAGVTFPMVGASAYDGINAKQAAIQKLLIRLDAKPEDSRPEFRQVLGKAFLKCNTAAKEAARPYPFSPAFMEAVVEATFKRVQEIWSSHEFMQDLAAASKAAEAETPVATTDNLLPDDGRIGPPASKFFLDPKETASIEKEVEDAFSEQLPPANEGKRAGLTEGMLGSGMNPVATQGGPRPPAPQSSGGSPAKSAELTARHGYLRARAEAIRAVKQVRENWGQLSGCPSIVIKDVLGCLERLDPDRPPEKEEREPEPEPEFKKDDWVFFMPSGDVRQLADPPMTKSGSHLLTIGHDTIRPDLTRHATFEQKYRRGAKVRITARDGPPVSMDGSLDHDHPKDEHWWVIHDRDGRVWCLKTERYNAELLEAAPREEVGHED